MTKTKKVKARKIELHRITAIAPRVGCYYHIYVTRKQLDRINRKPDDKQFFLSNRYALVVRGGGFHVIKKNGELYRIPWDSETDWLESLAGAGPDTSKPSSSDN